MNPRPSGFTLIEVVIAMMILTFLSLFTMQAVQNAIKTKAKVQKEIDKTSTLRDALRIMERDINMAFNYRDINIKLYNQAMDEKKKAGQKPPATRPRPRPRTAPQNPPGGPNRYPARRSDQVRKKERKNLDQVHRRERKPEFHLTVKRPRDGRFAHQQSGRDRLPYQELPPPLNPGAIVKVSLAASLKLHSRGHHQGGARNRPSGKHHRIQPALPGSGQRRRVGGHLDQRRARRRHDSEQVPIRGRDHH
ncbi:MAG: type II secretion system protein [Calothrix sp. SM1_5_4]|nr:type II secretion system protein [Calothrix sp. SM1_5_4]